MSIEIARLGAIVAVDIAGAERNLDKFDKSLGDSAKAVSDLARKTGQSGQSIKAFLSEFGALANESDRVKLAFKTFGAEAQTLVPELEKAAAAARQAAQGTDELGKAAKQAGGAQADAKGQTALFTIDLISLGRVVKDAALKLFNLVAEGAALGGEFADLATNTGLSAKELTLLNAAASLSGASLDQLQSGVATFENKLIEGGKAAKLMATAGLDLKQAIKDPTAGFLEFGRILSEIPDKALRVALAKKTLGDSGAKLLATFDTLNQEAVDFKGEMERLGVVLSDDTVKAADEVDDALGLLGLEFNALKVQIVGDNAPKIVEAINSIGGAVGGLKPILSASTGFFADWATDIARGADLALKALKNKDTVRDFIEFARRGPLLIG
jgi:hypothetical protein